MRYPSITNALFRHPYPDGVAPLTERILPVYVFFFAFFAFFAFFGFVSFGKASGFSEPAFASPDTACSVRTAGALYAAFFRKSLRPGSCFLPMSPPTAIRVRLDNG